jgi:hypothetical protein
MIHEYEILNYLAKRFEASDTFSRLGLKYAAVTTPINPLPLGEPDDIMPCVTFSAGEAHQFDPADERTQDATYNVKVVLYRPIYVGDNISDVMSRELAQIADEFKAWQELDSLVMNGATPLVLSFSGSFETLGGWFDKEKVQELETEPADTWVLACWGYFNLQVKITNEL